VTLNGFPYGDFGAPVVKHAVYRPDWSEAARAVYTRDLAVVLARLLPDDVSEGSISTLPLGWAGRWDAQRTALARRLMERLGDRLDFLEHRTGKHVRIGFEPEPGCVVESTSDAVEHLAGLDPRHFGVCLDCCHLAVAGEDPTTALRLLDRARIPVVKVQASCAVEADPGAPGALDRLRDFDERRFLHQVRTVSHGSLLGTDDLGEALDGGLPTDDAWRVHFHVPVHAPAPPPLRSTQPELRSALTGLLGGDVARTSHVDVETYTWEVLPEQVRPTDDDGLVAGLADELAWTRDHLIDLGLEVTR
jgi:hypothetical protein